MPLPSFGRDTAVVSGYLAAGYEAYLRLFMPLDSAEGPVRWSALLAGGEAALRGDLRFFDDIDPAVRERRGLELTCGKSDAGWRARLAGVLSGHTATPDDMRYALWPGYAGELDAMAGRLTPLPSAPGEARSGEVLPGNSGAFPRGTFPAELGCLLYRGPLEVVGVDVDHVGYLPCALWPRDGSFVLAQWIYDDSVYVSGSRKLAAALADGGFDVAPVDDPDSPLNSMNSPDGDVF